MIDITKSLKQKLEQYSNFDLRSKESVDGYSFLIRLMHEVIVDYIKFSNQEFADNPELQIPPDLEDDLFGVSILYQIFFPMAHTNEPLRSLKVVNARILDDEIKSQRHEITILKQQLNEISRLIELIEHRNTLVNGIINE
jgi:hypothetical protein